MDVLVVVDMQNDFISGALGSDEAKAVVPKAAEKIKKFNGAVLFTRDTHREDYLETQEGNKLPVIHCVEGTEGWNIHDSLIPFVKLSPVDKMTFGSMELPERILEYTGKKPDSITLIGLCTDICVISNAMILKSAFPEIPVRVDSSCCAGVTPESHTRALDAMASCQIEIM